MPVETWIGDKKWTYLSGDEVRIAKKNAQGKAKYPLCDAIFPDCPPMEERNLDEPPRGCSVCPYMNKIFLDEFKKKRNKEMKQNDNNERHKEVDTVIQDGECGREDLQGTSSGSI